MKILQSLDFPGIDADQVSRIVVDKKTEDGKKGFEAIYRAFGSTVLNSLGELDRPAMRRRMMQNPEDHKLLETIVHPLIIEYITKNMAKWKATGTKMGFIEGTRLIESGFHDMLSGIIYVSAPVDLRIRRVMKRDYMGKDEVTQMMQLQNEEMMKRVSKAEWKNSGSETALKKVIETWIQTRLSKDK